MARVKLSENNVPPLASEPGTGAIRLVRDGEECRLLSQSPDGLLCNVILKDGYTAVLMPIEVKK